MRRELSLAALQAGREFDLLVVGGGIHGAGVARDARARGLTVALVEKDDWASGTSSRSSRLIHGGLRYLEQGRVALVRESLRERATLLHIAPHLVRPLRFLAPAWGDAAYGLTTLDLGVAAYDLLAGRRRLGRRERMGPGEVNGLEPGLRRDRLQGAVSFVDARCDDARLVLALVRSAWEAGAAAVSYVQVDRFRFEGGRVCGAELLDRLSGARLEVRARAVVNATGPWADVTASLAGTQRPSLRLTRGAHIVVPRLCREALLLPTRDGRVLFVLPDGDYSILGTTDTDHRGPLEDVGATESDVAFLLAEASRALPRARLGRDAVIASFAALRPLVAGPGRPGSVSREHRIDIGSSGIVSVLGGKLTSFRSLADEVVRRAAEHIGRVVEPSATATLPLDGGDMSDPVGFSASATAELSGRYRVPRAQAERLVRTYGTRVTRVAALLEEAPHLLARLCPHHPHTALEAVYAAREEMAVRLSDFFFRRTRVAYGRCRGLDCADATAEAMALELGWSFARQADEAASFRQESEHLTVPRPD